MNDARSKLIVALDVPDRAAALRVVDQLSGHVGFFKVGLEIFTHEGPRLVEEIRGRGEKVFLDLKLHDIPNTVRGAVRSVCQLGVQMLTVHAAGGSSMLAVAAEEAQSASEPPLVLAVTALTSLASEDIRALGIGGSVEDWVKRLAELAYNSSIRGLVASSKELPMLRRTFQDGMKLVIPGIRPAGAEQQDQSRVAAPGEAILAGANYLVVGRPILKNANPAGAADAIVSEIQQAILSTNAKLQ